jgi:hypothetical protein
MSIDGRVGHSQNVANAAFVMGRDYRTFSLYNLHDNELHHQEVILRLKIPTKNTTNCEFKPEKIMIRSMFQQGAHNYGECLFYYHKYPY